MFVIKRRYRSLVGEVVGQRVRGYILQAIHSKSGVPSVDMKPFNVMLRDDNRFHVNFGVTGSSNNIWFKIPEELDAKLADPLWVRHQNGLLRISTPKKRGSDRGVVTITVSAAKAALKRYTARHAKRR